MKVMCVDVLFAFSFVFCLCLCILLPADDHMENMFYTIMLQDVSKIYFK